MHRGHSSSFLNALFINLCQHHVVVQIPMQDTRQFELGKMLHLKPQGPRRQPQLLANVDELAQLGTLERQRIASADLAQADPLSVEIGDHRDRRQPTLRCLRLKYRFHSDDKPKLPVNLKQKSLARSSVPIAFTEHAA